MTKRLALSVAVLSLALFPIAISADEAPKNTPPANPNGSADQTDSNFYWQGTQLYNLGRLGEAFESFEKAIQRKQNTKESEAYLLQIRQEIVNNAKKRSEERSTLNYGGQNPDSALNVTYMQRGHIRVTLQAKFLFDENTASLKSSAMDVINRLADVLQSKEGTRVEIDFVNELDVTPNMRDVDAERALLIFTLLNFKRNAVQSAS